MKLSLRHGRRLGIMIIIENQGLIFDYYHNSKTEL